MGRQSIAEYFLEHGEIRGEKTAAWVYVDGAYQAYTWNQLIRRAKLLCAALMRDGLAANERVVLLSSSRLDWILLDMAIVMAGGVTVPIYASNLADECAFLTTNSEAVVVLAENAAQAQKFISERANLPKVRRLVIMDAPVPTGDPWIVSLADLCAEVVIDEELIASRMRQLTKDSIFSIIYTSGTTGRPKGVICTHDNMLYEAEAISTIDLLKPSDTQLFFLPLAHVFARVLEVGWLALGHEMAFARSMNTIREDMALTSPTIIAGVPRVFEKFYNAVVDKGRQAPAPLRFLFNRALALSEKNGEAQQQGRTLSYAQRIEHQMLARTVMAKVKSQLLKTLGGRMRIMVSGGAPLAPKISWFFQDVGVEIVEGFGLTETMAATCVNRPGKNKIGTVGIPLPGTQVKLAEDGELLIGGRGVTPGYWHNAEATSEAIREGWFSTGDIARIEADGSVRIVDRKKDLIITAGGKNVAPQNIENLLKTDPIISQAVVHGDKRAYLTALLTVDGETAQKLCLAEGTTGLSYAEVSQQPVVLRAVQTAIEGFNKQLPRYETIKKYKVLEQDFTAESGELTASLKVKRRVIAARYKSVFDNFYAA